MVGASPSKFTVSNPSSTLAIVGGVVDLAEVKYPSVSSVGGDLTAPILVKNDGFNANIPISSNAMSRPKSSETESDITTALMFSAGNAASLSG